MLMQGKVVVVVGVANKASIAWAVAESLLREGATVVLTYQNERLSENVRKLAEGQNPPLETYELDATNSEATARTMDAIGAKHGRIDGLVHSIAFAPREDLQPGISRTVAPNYLGSIHVSAYTLIELTRAALPWFEKAGGGSVITMTYDTSKVLPNYNLMGIAKAALEQTMRYLAWDVGRKNVRVNAVSAGPIKTLAARGITGFSSMLDSAAKKAPLGRNVTVEEVAELSLFLLGPKSSGITGQTIFVDAGVSIVGGNAE